MFLNIEEAVPVIGYVIISKTDQGMELLKKINKILADNITGTIYNLQLQNYDVQLIERFLARSVPISFVHQGFAKILDISMGMHPKDI